MYSGIGFLYKKKIMVKDGICKLLRDKFWLTYQFEEQSLLLCLSNSLRWFWIHLFWTKNKLYRQPSTMKWKLKDQIQYNNIAPNKIVSFVTSMSENIIRKDYCKPQLLWPGVHFIKDFMPAFFKPWRDNPGVKTPLFSLAWKRQHSR